MTYSETLIDNKSVAVITFNEFDFIGANWSAEEREKSLEYNKSDKVSDKIKGLLILALNIENSK